jgi:hypothetical protein
MMEILVEAGVGLGRDRTTYLKKRSCQEVVWRHRRRRFST